MSLIKLSMPSTNITRGVPADDCPRRFAMPLLASHARTPDSIMSERTHKSLKVQNGIMRCRDVDRFLSILQDLDYAFLCGCSVTAHGTIMERTHLAREKERNGVLGINPHTCDLCAEGDRREKAPEREFEREGRRGVSPRASLQWLVPPLTAQQPKR